MTFPFFGGFALAVGCGSAQRVADFLFDVLFDEFRVLAHKFDVQHVFLPLYFFIQALQGLD